MRLKLTLILILLPFLFTCTGDRTGKLTPGLMISENGRYLTTENDEPFFWLGDTM